MRRTVALGVLSLVAGGIATVGASTPAYACHEIMTSENPVHNWICATVHETGVEEKVAGAHAKVGAIVKSAYCAIWEDPLCP